MGPGAAVLALTDYMGGREPSHGCRYCDIPLWQLDNDGWYAACPLCGVEADQLEYCRTCDRANCRNNGH